MKKKWFKRKQYGWGWTPVTWEGWLVMATYIAAAVYFFRQADAASHSGSDTLIATAMPFLLLTAALLAVCCITGERPRWQWGDSNPT